MPNQSNKHRFPAFDITRLKKIQYDFDLIELSGASKLVNERSVRRVVVFVAQFMEVSENGEKFVGVFALFEIIEKRDGGSELDSGGLVRPWLLFGFVAKIAMEVIRLNASKQLMFSFERGGL